ncbi:MAG: response regulator transcription factor [Bacteroidota bacterium]
MKILICDDHKLVRDGLRQILQKLAKVTLIDEARDGSGALIILKREVFDIVLLDISLPDISGLEVLQAIKALCPSINVLMLSMHPQEQYALRALKLGASGYLTKDTASEELLLAVKKISAGEKYISQSLAESIAVNLDENTIKQKHEMLSGREFEIMIRLANGKPLQGIGDELQISVKTVSTYRRRIMEKMEFIKNSDITKYCMGKSLV